MDNNIKNFLYNLLLISYFFNHNIYSIFYLNILHNYENLINYSLEKNLIDNSNEFIFLISIARESQNNFYNISTQIS
jgi:hypothetical protein